MGSLNRVMLIGNLGADPECRYTAGGQAVANLRVATSERYKDHDGKPQEKVEWHKVVCWGKQAELARDYLKRGRQVYIEGSLQTREYTDKDGIKRYSTEVKAMQIVFLGPKEAGTGQPNATGQPGSSGSTGGGWGGAQRPPANQGGSGWGSQPSGGASPPADGGYFQEPNPADDSDIPF